LFSRPRNVNFQERCDSFVPLASVEIMDEQTEKYLAWVKADQEQAELEHRVINRVQTVTLTLLAELTHNWQHGVDMANDPKERQTAVIQLIWCGAAEARFDFSLFSDAPPVRAQALVTGQWDQRGLPDEAQRQLGRLLRGTVSTQPDAKWDLRLTSEGEQLQHELRKHPENGWMIWDHVLTQRVPGHVGMRLLEVLPQAGASAVAVAGAQANASVGNITIQNQIDLGQLAALLQPRPVPAQATDDSGSRNKSHTGARVEAGDGQEPVRQGGQGVRPTREAIAKGQTGGGDSGSASCEGDADQNQKLSPSRINAKAVYDYAMNTIAGADKMTVGELFAAIKNRLDAETGKAHGKQAELLGKFRDSLPNNVATFRKYLNDAGVTRYGKRVFRRPTGSIRRREDI
jgi:hypothetical protein